MNVEGLTLRAATEAIRDGSLSPVEYAKVLFARKDKRNKRHVGSISRRLTGFLAGLRRRIRVLCQPRSENCPGLPIFFGEAGLSPLPAARWREDSPSHRFLHRRACSDRAIPLAHP